MTIDLLHMLKACKLFSALDDTALEGLITKFDKIYLHKNKILFRQGSLADGLYVLVSGKLSVILQSQHQVKKIIGEINVGETTGELGELTHGRRSATIKALEDSILLKLSSKEFKELCQNYPSVIHEIINTLAARTHNILQLFSSEEGTVKKHIVLVPASKKTVLKDFAEKIAAQAAHLSDVVVFSDYDEKFREHHNTEAKLQRAIDESEKKDKAILYLLESYSSALATAAFKKVDKIYIVGNGSAKPYISRFILEKFTAKKIADRIKPELILLHEKTEHLPQYTSRWLKLAKFALYHHVRINLDKDYQRVLRFIRGKALGLVLGGGGIRSWAHLGALRALHECNIPIDAIGGTSGGAIVAGYYAMYESYEDIHSALAELSEVTRKTVSVKNLTWPAISLFSSKTYTQQQRKMFASARIENLWLPFFCISCNLSNDTQVIHRGGYLWKAIRSSTSVPGVFPPVVIKGKLHLDGGILNNLPVDIMKKSVMGIENVVAVELTHSYRDDNEYNFPPVLTFGKAMMAKLGWGYQEYKFPPFVDTFLKSLLAGSSAKQKENGLVADVLISPDLSQFGLLNISKKHENELIELGYQAALQAIQKWQRKK